MSIAAIVCVDKSWGIGNNGNLLFHIKEDMKFFREKTKGHVIIYGRKTLESFPGKKPLPGRTNIVLTRNVISISDESKHACSSYSTFNRLKKFSDDTLLGAARFRDNASTEFVDNTTLIATTDIKSVISLAKMFNPNPNEDIFVCGGADIYKQLLPYCDKCYVTVVDQIKDADVSFPNLDLMNDWEVDFKNVIKMNYEKQVSDNSLNSTTGELRFLTYNRVKNN